jgi:hypothetical protein
MNADTLARVVALTVKAAIAPEQARSAALDRALTESRAELATLRERLAVLEARAPLPGPPGPAGADGVPGADGLSIDALEAVQAPEDGRLVTLRYRAGDVTKDVGTWRFPVPVYCGVYQSGGRYEPGDMVTWSGSQWHCNSVTSERPGLGNPTWTLAVKCGRDGKDAPVGAR